MSNNDVELGVSVLLNDMFSSGVGNMASAMGSLGSVLQSSMGTIQQYSYGLNQIASSTVAAAQQNAALSDAQSLLSSAFATTTTDAEAMLAQYGDLMERQIEVSSTLETLRDGVNAGSVSMSSYTSQVKSLTDEYLSNDQAMKSMAPDLENLLDKQGQQALALDQNSVLLAENTANAQNATDALIQMSVAIGVVVGASASFALFTSGLSASVSEAATLQQALTAVQIALNLTDQQMVSVGQSITQIADNSVFSTTQIAQSFQMLGERGFNATQIMNGVAQSAVDFAEATGAQAAPAADLLGRTMQVFNATASQSKQYADALTFAFYNGVPSISELSSVIDELGGTASELNIPINEVVASLDYLTQNGLQASDAGNTLRYMMSALIAPTQNTLDELSYLGVITMNQVTPAFQAFEDKLASTSKVGASLVANFDGTTTSLQQMYNQAKRYGTLNTNETFLQWAQSMGILNDSLINSDGSFKDLFGIIQQLGIALQGKGLSQSQLVTVLKSIFNVESGKGADILFGNIDKTKKGIQGLSDALANFSKSGGAATDANKVTSNFNGAIQKLQTTVGSFMAQIGTPLLGPLTNIVDAFNGLFSTTSKGQTSISTFGSTFLTVGTALSGVAVIVGIVLAGIALAGTTLGAVLLPVVGIAALVVVGIVAFSAAIAGLVTWMKSSKPIMDEVHKVFSAIANTLGPQLKPVVDSLKQAWSQFVVAIQPALPILKDIGIVIGAALIGVLGLLVGVLNMLGPIISGLAMIISGVLGGAIQFLTGVFQVVIGIIQVFWNIAKLTFGLLTGNTKIVDQALKGLGSSFHTIFTGIGNIVGGVARIITGVIGGLVTIVFGGISKLISGVLGFFGNLTGNKGPAATVDKMVNSIISWITQLPNQIPKIVKQLVSDITGFFEHLADVLVGHSIIPDMVNKIVSWITQLPGKALSMIQNFVSNIINGALGLAGSFHDKVIQPILDKLGDLIKQMPTLGANILKNLAAGIVGAIASTMGNAMSSLGNFISSHLPHSPAKMGPLMKLAEQGAEIPNQIAKGIHSNVGVLGAAATRMGNVLSPQTFLHPNGSSLSSIGSGSGTTTVQFVMDSKVVSQAVIDHATGQLKMNGVGRTLK